MPQQKTQTESPERGTPDMDVDIGGTPEPEGHSHDQEQEQEQEHEHEQEQDHEQEHETARDDESDAIVKQLERGLPRWEGFADVGWTQDISAVSDLIVCLSLL